MPWRPAVLACALAMLSVAGSASAQRRPIRIWTAAGLGTGGGIGHGHAARHTEGMVGMGQLVFQKAPHQLMLRGLVMADPFSDGSSNGAGELGVLYGRTATARFGHVAIATGLAFTGFDACGDPDDQCSTVGVPMVAEAALQPFDILGLGLQVFGNVNEKTSYAGMSLFLQLGWMP